MSSFVQLPAEGDLEHLPADYGENPSNQKKPEIAIARLGASDGSRTEVSGNAIKEGDQVISGERSASESK